MLSYCLQRKFCTSILTADIYRRSNDNTFFHYSNLFDIRTVFSDVIDSFLTVPNATTMINKAVGSMMPYHHNSSFMMALLDIFPFLRFQTNLQLSSMSSHWHLLTRDRFPRPPISASPTWPLHAFHFVIDVFLFNLSESA